MNLDEQSLAAKYIESFAVKEQEVLIPDTVVLYDSPYPLHAASPLAGTRLMRDYRGRDFHDSWCRVYQKALGPLIVSKCRVGQRLVTIILYVETGGSFLLPEALRHRFKYSTPSQP